MTFIELLRKAQKFEKETLEIYRLTKEDLLSLCIDDSYFIFCPDFWEDKGETYNSNLIKKFEEEGYLIRSDKTQTPDELNPTYVYLVIK